MDNPSNNTSKDIIPPLEKRTDGQPTQMNVNANERANENVPDTEKNQTTGVGSEITDGESG